MSISDCRHPFLSFHPPSIFKIHFHHQLSRRFSTPATAISQSRSSLHAVEAASSSVSLRQEGLMWNSNKRQIDACSEPMIFIFDICKAVCYAFPCLHKIGVNDLVDSCYAKNPKMYCRFSVMPKTQKCIADIDRFVKDNHYDECGIIYCLSRLDCEKVAKIMQDFGHKVAFYHANIDSEERATVQTRWTKNEINIICATVAFGMGINKSDVRFVIHHSLPKSIEGYHQINIPKDRRQPENSGASPYKCSSSNRHQKLPLLKTPSENKEILMEWEEARCPVCMEHPHKAILLLCSSHDNNCRPYLCDTSSRHSNSYDQFLKSPESELACPLCRGPVMGSVVVEPAREFMNKKSRTCSSETCEFSGTYRDLKKHAREAHHRVRPSEADPRRQREWEQLKRMRGLGDVFSHLRSLEPSLPMIMRDEGRRAMVTAGIFSMMQSIMPMSMTVEDLNGYCGYIYSDWNMRFV